MVRRKVHGLTEKWDQTASAFSQGLALGAGGRHQEALAYFLEAISHDKNHLAARFNLAIALRHLDRKVEAIDVLQSVLQRLPDQLETLFCLAELLNDMDRHSEALKLLTRVARSAPDYKGLAKALGLALLRTNAPEKAEAPLRRAMALEPDCAATLNNLGAAYMAQRRPKDAERFYRRAATLDNSTPIYRKNLGVSELLQGDLIEGFRHYEARREQAVWRWNRDFSGKPEWQGEAISGCTIIVYFEQGLGDTVQFVRYFPILKAMGAKTIFLCQPELVSLLSTANGIDCLITEDSCLPDFDYHTSLMSLPNRLGTNLSTIPAEIPYLSAAPDIAQWWAKHIGHGGLRIGIHLQASGPGRSIPAEALAPLAAISSAQLYSLQPDVGTEREPLLTQGIALRDEIAPQRTSFADTAGMIANIDLAVCCDSSVAHIAGAMGVPVMLILPWLADWRWMLHPVATPWYPSTRLFRCPAEGKWEMPISAVAAAIMEPRLI